MDTSPVPNDYHRVVDQFCAEMRNQGLETDDNIKGDGKLHRMHVVGDPKGDKSGWYILHVDDRPAGSFGCNRRYPDEKFSWTDKSRKRPMSLQEKKAWEARLAEQEQRRAEAEAVRHRIAAERAADLWSDALDEPVDSDFPYLVEKGVKAYGLRVGRWEYVNDETGEVSQVTDRALLLPLRDRQGTIHSLQGIFPDKTNFLKRRKDYLKGGAKRGNFLGIGRPQSLAGRPVFIVCEGYATGASIHMATGHCVLVTFDISNLAPVAQSLRDRRADAIIVVAADNDQWTLRPIRNPGVELGGVAAHAVKGVLAFPPFDDAEGYEIEVDGKPKRTGPTDFNDYHLAYGLDAVNLVITEALERAIAPVPAPANDQPVAAPPAVKMLAPADDEPPFDDGPALPPEEPGSDLPAGEYDDDELVKNQYFTVLGYDQDTYYFFHHAKGQILGRTRRDLNPMGLVELAPLNWWQEYFPASGAAKIEQLDAFQWIIHRAHGMGIYDPTRVRGRGAWTDNHRVVYHHGPYLTVDGARVELTHFESGYVYTRAKSLPFPHINPLTNEEGAHLLAVAGMPRWTMEGSAALMAGWVMLAAVCGALTWRPHIWISGGAGTGKTTLQARFCGALTRGTNVYAQGNSTEAGLRQVLAGDALPVMIDEFESNDEKERVRVENIMSLIRQTSSETQAKTYKGTVSGDGMRYDIRSMFCLSSINTNLPTKADIDRLTVLRLKSEGADNWDALEAELNRIDQDPEIAARLLARAMNLLPAMLAAVKVFRRVAAKHFDRQRDGDQFGTLLAGCWSLAHDTVPTDADAEALIQRFDWSEHREDADMDEHDKTLGALLSAKLRLGNGQPDVTVYELACEVSEVHRKGLVDAATAINVLGRHGMKLDFVDKVMVFGVSVKPLKDLARSLASGTDLRGQLMRIPGATKGPRTVSFVGSKSRVVMIPLSRVFEGEVDSDDPF